MAYTVPTLEGLIHAYMEERPNKKLPSGLHSDVQYCSRKLYEARTKTEEDFDAVLAQYRMLDERLKSAIGLELRAFEEMIMNLKEAYYR